MIIFELKRGQTPREVVAQTLDYGSWVRNLNSGDIADTFIDYQRDVLKKETPVGINDALLEKFDFIPDELNSSHRLLIVAEELDSSTERIVKYLQEVYEVDINVVLFRTFQDEDRLYLTRTWLTEPDFLATELSSSSVSKREWNGEYYVSFGEGVSRRWNDAKRYGFVSGGGGEWYVKTLRRLQPGNRIWVSVPGKGYVGVGEVLEPAVPFYKFKANMHGTLTPITELEIEAPEAFDKDHDEHFVAVKWIKKVELQKAVKERNFFGNQNTVARPRDPRWPFTVERLKTLWGID